MTFDVPIPKFRFLFRNSTTEGVLVSTSPTQTPHHHPTRPLELHQVGPVTLAQRERGGDVAGKLGNLLDVLDEGSIDFFLVGLANLGSLLLLRFGILSVPVLPATLDFERQTYRHLVTLEELFLLGLLRLLLAGEVLVVELVDVDIIQIDGGRGSDNVASVNAAKRDTVDLEGASDQEDAVGQRLEIHDALATESSSEDDQDRARLERGTEGSRPDALADLWKLH
jgi:hypothetical protein